MDEAAFTTTVMQIAAWGKWRAVHIRNVLLADGQYTVPYQGDSGLGDLILARADRGVLMVELKVGRNKPTVKQQAWLDAAGADGRLWYPENLDAIKLELLGRPA
jgi:hypothetical protein